jgi:hypothetical protein
LHPGALILLMVSFAACNASAMDAIVKRRAGLRAEPSATQLPIVILDARETVAPIEPSATGGFFHVRTLDGEEGWISSRFLEFRGGNITSPP